MDTSRNEYSQTKKLLKQNPLGNCWMWKLITFVGDIHTEELNDNHLDELIDRLSRNVTKSLDIHTPLKTVKIKSKEHQPWYTNELAELNIKWEEWKTPGTSIMMNTNGKIKN